jgi:hypothetical protein
MPAGGIQAWLEAYDQLAVLELGEALNIPGKRGR